MNSVETLTLPECPDFRARIEYEQFPTSPEEWGGSIAKIAYHSTRYTLGTEQVSFERMNKIAQDIAKGYLIGLPVYAYVHSGATISCGARTKSGALIKGNPFHCQWDSGQSGFVYVEKEKALKEFGRVKISHNLRHRIENMLVAEVETYDMYLTGDVYTVFIERIEGDDPSEYQVVESLGDVYGLDAARQEAKSMLSYEQGQYAKEKAERDYWAMRGIAAAA